MFRSIRVWLALSYAGVALLVILSLGGVLLFSLRAYYGKMEQEYLTSNAKAMSALAAPMLVKQYPKDVQDAQVSNLAFLSQTRVRILDPQRNVLADSGPVQATNIGLGMVANARVQINLNNKPDEPNTAHANPSSVIVVQRGSTVTKSVDGTGNITSFPSGNGAAAGGPPDIFYFNTAVPVSKGVYGLYLSQTAIVSLSRSTRVVQESIVDSSGKLLGYVELSGGPAYGREIVASVASGLAVAGALAILLAIGAGWLTSRLFTTPLSSLTQATQQMSSGDLAVRVAEAGRGDEFGVLGKSFNQMAGRIEEIVHTLRQFLSDAAHELQTPLTALRTNLELARGDANSSAAENYIDLALEQSERLQRLIKDLLSLSRLETANGQDVFQPVDLVELTLQASEPFAARAEQADQSFELNLPSGPALVMGSPDQLRSALCNLLDNALKFTPPGGRITIQLSEEEKHLCLEVSDTGIGIPVEEIEMLFNRFHRARNASAYPGSGLGLAIVKAIAQSHGGSVQAANNSQGGASIKLFLPKRTEWRKR